MEFLNKFNLKPMAILKIIGLGFLGVIFLVFALRIISSSVNPILQKGISGQSFSKNIMMDEMAYSDKGGGVMESLSLSSRNVAPRMPSPQTGTTGSDAEDFEVTEYNATIKTRQLEKTCSAVSSLKVKEYVIFENANEYDNGCNYTFKVKKDNKDEVLTVIESLDPKELTENTRTIKRLLDDFTSETEILNKKKETIENTLNNAINSYDEISQVATRAQDAESLAKIIDSKIRIIERLSNERIKINEQLDRLGRSKAEQMDRLEYIFFRVNIYEDKFIDGERLKDSWKNEIKNFVFDISRILQDSSVGVIRVIFLILQYALYLLVLLVSAKFAWKIGKYIWNK